MVAWSLHFLSKTLSSPCCSVAEPCLTLQLLGLQPGSSAHGISQAKKTGVGCHFLLPGIFPTQWLNLHLLHCQAGSLPLSHQGSPLPTLGFPDGINGNELTCECRSKRHRFDPWVQSIQIKKKKKKKKKKTLQEDNFKCLESGSIRLKGFNNLSISLCAFKM